MTDPKRHDGQPQDRPDETASPRPPRDTALPENGKAELDERLDEAVEETFPASDPVSVKITK